MKNSHHIFCMISLPTYLCVIWHLCKFQKTDYTTVHHVNNSYRLSSNDNQKMLHDCNLEPRTAINNFRTKNSLTTTGSPHFPQKTKISLVIRSWYTLSERSLTTRSKENYQFSCKPLPHVHYKQRASQNYWEVWLDKMLLT